MKLLLYFILLCSVTFPTFSQVVIDIDLEGVGRSYSPYIFGKNNTLSDNPERPLSYSDWIKIKDSGITILRENGGNNSTKYNWRRKLSSHPDWYNNVYVHDWDFIAKSLADSLPGRQGIFGLQVLGKAARTNDNNFNEWEYNQAAWWDGVHQNLAGGGVVDPLGGSAAMSDGDPDLYLMDWPADSTVAIFDHWFNQNSLDLGKEQFLYWCMDNEPSIWNHTHDDIASNSESAENYVQKYFKVAKAARAKFPGVKLIGPIAANEWQWYNWHNERISYNGKTYSFLEYFILRIGEEQETSGMRLLDVFSIHFYPGNQNVEEVVQFHRVYFDEEYVYPDANGVKTINGGWDESINKEYVFRRCLDWMEEHIGIDHAIGLGVTETGVAISDQNGVAVWYASTLGEFMKQGVELFTPWSWQPSMWEVVNLFTQYSNELYFDSKSNDDELVSAYTTTDESKKKITNVLVNRSLSSSKSVTVNLKGVYIDSESIKSYKLSNLGESESFYSNTENALVEDTPEAGYTSFKINLPPLSVVAVNFATTESIPTGISDELMNERLVHIYPNPLDSRLINIETNLRQIDFITLISLNGKSIKTIKNPLEQIDLGSIPDGLYLIQIHSGETIIGEKILLN